MNEQLNLIDTINKRRMATSFNWRASITPLFALLLFGTGVWNLSASPMWWDEGWTLSVARTWVERGHYGRLLDGQLAPPGLEATFPTTGLVALSFKFFGVGIWQGRLVGVVCTVVALALMYYLSAYLYNRAVAIGTLAVLLLMSVHPQLHPVIMGRQVLAEMPMFCYLLAGYAFLLATLQRSLWFLAGAITFWGIALITKAQALPFWTLSLLVPMLVMLVQRRWRLAGLLGIGLGGAIIASRALSALIKQWLHDNTLPTEPLYGLYNVMALVLVPFNRLFALQITLMVGLPTVLGLGYAAWYYLRWHRQTTDINREIMRLALLTLAGSWFAWYLLLSVGVPRYLFPATFFGSMFVASLLYDLTDQFNLISTLQRGNDTLRRLHFGRQNMAALLAIILIAATLPLTILSFYRYYLIDDDRSAQRIAHFFNTQTADDVLIETYESELHFLLDRSYHYPPDQVHVELNRRSLLHQQVEINYDPLAADPDYLVVGRFSRDNELYTPVLTAGAFHLLFRDGLYDVYVRIR